MLFFSKAAYLLLLLVLLGSFVQSNQAYAGRTKNTNTPGGAEESSSSIITSMSVAPPVSNASSRVLPSARSASEWPHFPIFVRAGDDIEVLSDFDETDGLPLGIPIEFESPLFIGKILIRLKAIPPTPKDESNHAAYFKGRKRHYQCIVQGKFKENGLRFSDVFVGDVYDKPFRGMPSGFIMKAFKAFMEAINPGMIFDMASDRPRLLNPIGSVQEISIDVPGQEPDIVGWNAMTENVNLLRKSTTTDSTSTTGKDRVCAGEESPPMFKDAAQRRKVLSKPQNSYQYTFQTDKVYTFHIYDHTANIGAYQQDLGMVKIDIAPSLNGQPLSLSAITKDDRYVFRFELWHERILKQ